MSSRCVPMAQQLVTRQPRVSSQCRMEPMLPFIAKSSGVAPSTLTRGRGLGLHEAGEALLAEPVGRCWRWGGVRLWQGLAGEPGELLQGEVDTALVVVHAVRRQGEGGDAGLLLEDAADGAAVGGDHMGDLRGNQADKARLELFGSCFDICDEFGVVAEDGVLLGQGGDEDLARLAEPARLVVRRVGRVAARGVVDDDHAAELVECRADAEGIG